MCVLLFSSIACASESGSEGAQDTGLIVVCVFCCFPVLPVPVSQVQKALRTRVSSLCVCLLFSSIASASDSGSEGAQDTGLIVVCVFCCFPVLPVPVIQVQKALRTRVS